MVMVATMMAGVSLGGWMGGAKGGTGGCVQTPKAISASSPIGALYPKIHAIAKGKTPAKRPACSSWVFELDKARPMFSIGKCVLLQSFAGSELFKGFLRDSS